MIASLMFLNKILRLFGLRARNVLVYGESGYHYAHFCLGTKYANLFSKFFLPFTLRSPWTTKVTKLKSTMMMIILSLLFSMSLVAKCLTEFVYSCLVSIQFAKGRHCQHDQKTWSQCNRQILE